MSATRDTDKGISSGISLIWPRYGAYRLSVGAGRIGSNLGAVWLIKTCRPSEVPHLGRFAQYGQRRGAAAPLVGGKHLSQATSLTVEDPPLPTADSQRVE